MRIHKKPRFFSKLFKGFTLVELIVVISVLAVLATIAMTQVSNITAWARDSQRMTDMSAMKSSIELYKAKTGKLPIPTNGSGVTYSWGILWTQGTFGEPTWRQLNSITPKPVDPNNAIEYVYSVANNNREFELGGILEKATGLVPSLFQELLAASQNVTFIEGTYNGVSLKIQTGSKTYVVAAPSLIGGSLGNATMETTLLTLDGLWSLPLGFSGTVVSSASTGTFAPVVGWSGAKLPETLAQAEAMIIGMQKAYSGTVATSLSQISSLVSATGSQITALWEGIVENSLGGNVSGIATPEKIITCATGYILVPGNTTFNTTDFCAMKYEAKSGGANNSYGGHTFVAGEAIVSTPTNAPVASMTQQQAITACAASGTGRHLITNKEWMTIARNIESVAANWSNGIVGSSTGYINNGHNDSAPNAALLANANDLLGYENTGNSAGSGPKQKRTHTLSNGNVIWDMSGNMWEHVNKANTLDGTNFNSNTQWIGGICTTNSYVEFSSCTFRNSYTCAEFGPKTCTLSAINNGIWQIYNDTALSNIVFFRGGFWAYSEPYAGIYEITTAAQGSNDFWRGFRCAYIPE